MNSVRVSAIKLGIATAVIALMAAMLVTVLRTPVKGTTGQTFTALIEDVSGLHRGADVRMAGVQVGKVTDIELDGTVAAVTFNVRDDQVVYDNTVSAVLFQSLVGQRYLALLQQEAPGARLESGSTIPLEQTQSSFDISELFDAVRPIFETVSSGSVDDFLQNLLLLVSGDGRGLGPVLDDLDKIISVAADQDPIVTAIADNLASMVDRFEGKAPLLDQMIDRTMAMLDQVHGHTDLLKSLLDTGVPGLGVVLPWVDQISALYYDNFPGFDRLYNEYVPSVAISLIRQTLAAVPLAATTLNGLFLDQRSGQRWSCLAGLPIPTTVLVGTERMELCK
ncbi:MlaD family protein [Antrihabitans sp. YC2-6]|uniref:MlaD family protein n=1 Tax=Antrihabitans sp. YC2-6 TaxID=2799498 RepID=UPI0018F6BA16|nr:MCE family protein [Antrihabitans sp. YC2-6]MBJ8346717.1 MCE family protein [Antrihabitans sp. YC2-6]